MSETNNANSAGGFSRREILMGTAGAAAVGAMGLSRKAKASNGRLVVNGLEASLINPEYLDLARTGGADCVHKSIGDLNSVADIYGLCWQHSDRATVARSVAEIRQAKAEGKLSFILGSQVANQYEKALYTGGFGVLGSYKAMRAAVTRFRGLGVAIQGLCYNTTNVFGSGCLDDNGPLTRSGAKLVESLHEHKIVLDIGGHCGERTSLDAIEMSSGVPIVCTHTNFATLNDNARAITDHLAEKIAATGGVIGITAVSAFHVHNSDTQHRTEDLQATLDQHLDQYDHAKKIVGAEHVGLGPDFIWGWGPHMPIDPEDVAAFPPWTMAPGPQSTVEGFEDISKLPNLIAGLKDRGWYDSELDMLLGANWLRVYKDVWGG